MGRRVNCNVDRGVMTSDEECIFMLSSFCVRLPSSRIAQDQDSG